MHRRGGDDNCGATFPVQTDAQPRAPAPKARRRLLQARIGTPGRGLAGQKAGGPRLPENCAGHRNELAACPLRHRARPMQRDSEADSGDLNPKRQARGPSLWARPLSAAMSKRIPRRGAHSLFVLPSAAAFACGVGIVSSALAHPHRRRLSDRPTEAHPGAAGRLRARPARRRCPGAAAAHQPRPPNRAGDRHRMHACDRAIGRRLCGTRAVAPGRRGGSPLPRGADSVTASTLSAWTTREIYIGI